MAADLRIERITTNGGEFFIGLGDVNETIQFSLRRGDPANDIPWTLQVASTLPLIIGANSGNPITFDIPEVDEVDQLGEISIPDMVPEETPEEEPSDHEDIRPHNSNMKCGNCADGKLILRKNRKTGHEFWGCSNYPKCKKTLSAQ